MRFRTLGASGCSVSVLTLGTMTFGSEADEAASHSQLAWLRDRPAVTSVILGARTLEQLEDDLGAADLDLSSEEVATLDQASDPGAADYPYGVPGSEQRSRRIEGGR